MARIRNTIGGATVAVVLVAATVLIAVSFTSLGELVRALEGASWPWIAGGVAVHLAYFAAYAVLYWLGFRVVGVASEIWALVPLVFAGLFVNIVIPTGAGAAALFVDDAARRGESAAHTAIGAVLVLLLDLVTLLPFVAWAIWYLASAGLFTAWAAVATAVFVLYLVGLGALLGLARAHEPGVRRLLGWVRRRVGRIASRLHRKGPIDEDWPARTASRFAAAARAIGRARRRVAVAAGWAVLLHAINLVGLWMFMRGFGAAAPFGGVVAAFSLGIVFFVVVVIPQAAPIVEATMIAIFVHEGIAAGCAVAATLAFRAVNFWLPLFVGLAFASRIRRFGQRAEPP